MRIQPDSTINLYSGVDIDITSGVEIAFKTIANQRAYFASKLARSQVPCTMVKKTGKLKLEVPGSVVKNCNYLSFTNPSFDNKTFYGVITNYDYINNECVEISYIFDWWQSYMFEVTYERMGIDRQYLNETDYAKATANPYDPSIFAFQTGESLSYDKKLEPRKYQYKVSSTEGSNALLPANNVNYDGGYGMMATHMNELDAVAVMMKPTYYLLVMAPVEYNELVSEQSPSSDTPAQIVQRWLTALTNNANHTKGRYIAANVDQEHVTRTYTWTTMLNPCDIWIVPSNIQISGVPMIKDMLTKFTTWGIDSQIMGIYGIPEYMIDSFTVDSGTALARTMDLDNTDNVKLGTSYALANTSGYAHYKPHCQKLYTHPFSYVRMENPAGEAIEYKYEDFYDVSSGDTTVLKFRTMSLVNGTPTTYIIPLRYKVFNSLPHSPEYPTGITADPCYPDIYGNFNLDERFAIENIPPLAFMTDGWLTHLSSVYHNNIASRDYWTNDNQEIQGEILGLQTAQTNINGVMNVTKTTASGAASGAAAGAAVGSIFGPVGTVIGGIGGALLGGGMGAASGGIDYEIELKRLEQARNEYAKEQETYGGFNAFMRGEEPLASLRMSNTKPAYANNIYHPGSTADILYTFGTGIIDFRITQVRLRDEILQSYDEYFKAYGYNFSGYVDIPYLIKYTQNSSNNDEIPHWEKVNGKDSTYIKTVDAHVTHAMLPVSQAIAGMFNGGVRMLRGEDLYV